jgi:hypothetical protein
LRACFTLRAAVRKDVVAVGARAFTTSARRFEREALAVTLE